MENVGASFRTRIQLKLRAHGHARQGVGGLSDVLGAPARAARAGRPREPSQPAEPGEPRESGESGQSGQSGESGESGQPDAHVPGRLHQRCFC